MRVRPWLAIALVAVVAAAAVVHVARRVHSAQKRQREKQNTELLDAVRSESLAGVKQLLEEGAEPEARDTHGSTALHLAAWKGNRAIAEALLKAGADVNASDFPEGPAGTPLDTAAFHGHENIVKLLLEHGASLGGCPESQATPLIAATCGGQEQVASFLVEKGADVNQPDPVYGRPPILWAVAYDQPKMLELLLRRGAQVDLRSRSGQTALEYAVDTQRESLAKILLANGATMSLRTAAALGDLQAIERLLAAGSDVNSQDQQGRTALDYAIAGGHPDAVAALIAAGADVNPREGRQSPLYRAVAGEHVEIARVLIEAGADVNATGPLGETLLDVALRKGRREPRISPQREKIAELLRKHGVKTLRELKTQGSRAPVSAE